MPVTELTAQQLGYFERESAHTLEFRFIHPLKDNRRRAIEKKLVYIVYSCQTGDFWPFQHLEMAVPVTELTPQQLGYFESESTHTLILRSIHVLKD